MRAGAGVVADPDTEVLHFLWFLLMDLTPNISTHPHPRRSFLQPLDFLALKLKALRKATHLVQAHNLTIRLLDLPQFGQEVPEAALGNDIVRGEDAHAVELGVWVGIGGQVAPDDLIFQQASCQGNRISAVLRIVKVYIYSTPSHLSHHCGCRAHGGVLWCIDVAQAHSISMLFLPSQDPQLVCERMRAAALWDGDCLPICCRISMRQSQHPKLRLTVSVAMRPVVQGMECLFSTRILILKLAWWARRLGLGTVLGPAILKNAYLNYATKNSDGSLMDDSLLTLAEEMEE